MGMDNSVGYGTLRGGDVARMVIGTRGGYLRVVSERPNMLSYVVGREHGAKERVELQTLRG